MNLKRNNKQIFIEFSGQKGIYFDRWSLSKEVGFENHKHRQMILNKEFKECVSQSVKTYLDEKRVDSVQ